LLAVGQSLDGLEPLPYSNSRIDFAASRGFV
jgi:hypothetical protein